MMRFNIRVSEQKGFVLLTSLIFLVVLTLFILSSVRIGTLQLRMLGNLEDRSIAFQNADIALRTAEVHAYNNNNELEAFADDCNATADGDEPDQATVGLCKTNTVDWKDADDAKAKTGEAVLKVAGAGSPGRFYVVWNEGVTFNRGGYRLGSSGLNVGGFNVFTLVAQGTGRTPESAVTVEQVTVIPKPAQQ